MPIISEDVIDIVEGHVDAKRYLVSRDERYNGRLSDVSTRSLEAQGGAMTSEEARNFEKTTRFEEKLRVRAWDGAGESSWCAGRADRRLP